MKDIGPSLVVSVEEIEIGLLALGQAYNVDIAGRVDLYLAVLGKLMTEGEWREAVREVLEHEERWPPPATIMRYVREARESDYETREREDAEDLAEMERQADRERSRA